MNTASDTLRASLLLVFYWYSQHSDYRRGILSPLRLLVTLYLFLLNVQECLGNVSLSPSSTSNPHGSLLGSLLIAGLDSVSWGGHFYNAVAQGHSADRPSLGSVLMCLSLAWKSQNQYFPKNGKTKR